MTELPPEMKPARKRREVPIEKTPKGKIWMKLLAGYRTETPKNALRKLSRLAVQDSHAGRAALYFLFWLDGETAPDGENRNGAGTFMDFDAKQKAAMFEVLKWVIEPGARPEPLETIQKNLKRHFAAKSPKDVPSK